LYKSVIEIVEVTFSYSFFFLYVIKFFYNILKGIKLLTGFMWFTP